jgi:hypothetical protein
MSDTKGKKITPEQQRALDIIQQHGSICRYEGGFWAKPNDEIAGVFKKELSGRLDCDFHYPENHVGTNTIKALLKKGLIEVSEEKISRGVKFAVRCSPTKGEIT